MAQRDTGFGGRGAGERTRTRVLHLTGQFGLGGGERQLFLLLAGTDRVRFEPMVVVLNASQRDYWTPKARELGVEVVELPAGGASVRRFFNLLRLLGRLRPAVFQSWNLRGNTVVACSGGLMRVPHRVGSLRCNLHRAGRGPAERWATTRGLHCIVANSTQGRRDLEGLGVRPERIEVIFNGVEPAPDGTDSPGRSVIRQSWGADEQDVVLATIGNLSTPKNYPLLIQVVKALRERGHPVRAVVYGGGPLREALETRCREAGLVDVLRFLGQQPDARTLVAAADLFVFTSFGEGMANALLEGSLAGLPVVTTEVGGAEDVVVPGQTGFIVPVDDAPAMVRAIEGLMGDRDRRRKMGERGRRRVQEEFSLGRMVSRFEALYAAGPNGRSRTPLSQAVPPGSG